MIYACSASIQKTTAELIRTTNENMHRLESVSMKEMSAPQQVSFDMRLPPLFKKIKSPSVKRETFFADFR